jgi:hypothetical protein
MRVSFALTPSPFACEVGPAATLPTSLTLSPAVLAGGGVAGGGVAFDVIRLADLVGAL